MTLPILSPKATRNFSNISHHREPLLPKLAQAEMWHSWNISWELGAGGHSTLFVWFGQIPFYLLGIASIFFLWGIVLSSLSVFVCMEGEPPTNSRDGYVSHAWRLACPILLATQWPIRTGHVMHVWSSEGQSWDTAGNSVRIGALFLTEIAKLIESSHGADGDHLCPYKEAAAIPLLGIYPEKTIIQEESCTTMFIVALFTIARTWKQPKCPSTDEWIKKMWHIYTMEYYSAIKRKEIELFVVRWMALESFIQWSKSERENKYRMLTHIYGI